MLTVFASAAQAENLLNWLDGISGQRGKAIIEADDAVLLTLEERQSEMYPRVSPDGKYLLALTSHKHQAVITRRLVENGDPIDVVSNDDALALASIQWRDNENVTFLSHRADSLGVWQKPVDGGVTRRLHGRLDGELKEPIVLEDGSIIAVRLQRKLRNMDQRKVHKKHKMSFDNWTFDAGNSQVVHLTKDGVEHVLASGENPALSPDGKRVVFAMQAGRSWHLFVMNVDGSELLQLTEGRSIDVQPTWSSDGRWVAFTSNRAATDMRHTNKGNWDVWMIAQDGRNLVRLTTDKAMDGAPDFAKNGRIYFHSNRKVTKSEGEAHEVSGSSKGFHIWSVKPPMIDG